MLSENTKTLKLNQYQKSDKVPFIIYADLESLIEKNNKIQQKHNKNTAKVQQNTIKVRYNKYTLQ